EVLERAVLRRGEADGGIAEGGGRELARLRDVRRNADDFAGDELEPVLLRERHHVVEGADHAHARIAADRGGERAAPGVAIDPPFLHQDVEGLANGGAADLVAGAERVLRGDLLALAAELTTDVVRDLEITRDAGTVVHQ